VSTTPSAATDVAATPIVRRLLWRIARITSAATCNGSPML
jgi:hypothetical protein